MKFGRVDSYYTHYYLNMFGHKYICGIRFGPKILKERYYFRVYKWIKGE
jgi:hypothetical protein